MKPDRRLLTAVLAPGVSLAAWLTLGAGLLLAALGPAPRQAVRAALGPLIASHGMLAVGWWLAAAALFGWAGYRLHQAHVVAPSRLLNAARVLASDASAPAIQPQGGATIHALASAINDLAAQRQALAAEMERLVAEASRSVAEQRDQLAALMGELNQAVVVCTLEGRILLYNARMRELSRRLSPHGADVIGLGRSIHALIDGAPIAHALEIVGQRIARGSGPGAEAAKFVTTVPGGALLQVSLAPVRPSGAGDSPTLTGYVLLLDDITIEQEAQASRDRQHLGLTEATRASVASMQAALEMLDYPDLDAEERERFLCVVRDEVAAMGARLAELAAASSHDMIARWPLQDMLGADLLAAAKRRLQEETGSPVVTNLGKDDLWLKVDSFGLIEALAFLARRVGSAAERFDPWLRLAPVGQRAHLDLGWSIGGGTVPPALAGLRDEPMQLDGTAAGVTVRDVVERHGGEVWLERDRKDGRPFFRFLLPLATGEAAAPATTWASRPEFYDFDLFADGAGTGEMDGRPLAGLAFTVFDTETTGLDPAGGDEIIQIGAVRVVNGRILRGESLDQLIDPQRSIPEAGIPIHGIHPHMVRGQPTIAEALPAFHAFVGDSVLVGHNIAFDMRFLKLKEAQVGVRFDQPLLDTLLLSSIVHPAEPSHSLEAIAERLGVTIAGRHTALGDAIATAEVFVKLLPQLSQQGIVTLGQARAASGASQFARLKY